MQKHIHFDPGQMRLLLLDQRALPLESHYISCHNVDEVISAIQLLVVRGAPAIGVAAAWGCVLAAGCLKNEENWQDGIVQQLQKLRNARPTAVNLAWAVDRMQSCIPLANNQQELLQKWLEEARIIQEEDEAICRRLGSVGEKLIPDGATILTHCNAGALATAEYGTALGIIRSAVQAGKKVQVIADETRPFLQGSRLTAYELMEDRIPVTIACDNACALLMSRGLVNLVITGADRIAANGDTANKIGTLGVAIMAKYYNIPFYIAAPLSTIDANLPDGTGIPIEQRPADEVLRIGSTPIAPNAAKAFNFAFDVTPAELITAIITEAGIIKAPYKEAISHILENPHGK